jgi:hypothetical protein
LVIRLPDESRAMVLRKLSFALLKLKVASVAAELVFSTIGILIILHD